MSSYLIIHTGGGLGDLLLSTIVIEALHRADPQAEIDFLVRASNKPALSANPHLRQILTCDAPRPAWSQLPRWMARLRAQRYQTALLLWSNTPWAYALWGAGIPRRVGQDSRFSYSWTFTHPVPIRSEHGDTHSHWTEILLDFVRALDLPVASDLRPYFAISPAAHSRALELLKRLPPGEGPIIGFHPSKGVAHLERVWPWERLGQYVEALEKELGARLYLSGGPAERPLIDELLRSKSLRALNLAGETDIETLAALAAHSQLFVCPDSGPAHLASIVGTPVVDLLALKEEFPQRWAPRWAPYRSLRPSSWSCQREPCRKNLCPYIDCYREISPQQVVGAARELLEEVSSRSISK